MKKRRPHKRLPRNHVPATMTAKTGDHCPTTGYWMTSAGAEDRRFITEGSVMPAIKGQSATWTLMGSKDLIAEPKDPLSSQKALLTPARYNLSSPFWEQWHTAGMPLDVLEHVPLRKVAQPVKSSPEFPVNCEEGCFYCESPETD